MQEKLNKKIADALASVEGIQRAAAPDFFYARLEGRMLREKNVWEKISSFVARPAIAFGCMAVIILMNSFIIFSDLNRKDSNVPASELASVDEYTEISNSSLFEFENIKP